jgi:hypothetical protein
MQKNRVNETVKRSYFEERGCGLTFARRIT